VISVGEDFDIGGIHARTEVQIGPRETAIGLRNRLVDTGVELLVATLTAGLEEPIPQIGEPTWAEKLTVSDRELDWSLTAVALDRLVRAGDAWTLVHGRRLKVLAAEPSADGPESVTVEKGDSLSKIAKRYGTTVDALVRINELCDANQIFVGQVILLEDLNVDETAEQTATSTVIVTVEVGDSLTKIAKRHDTSVEAIMELNDIDDPNLLFVGQELVIDGEVPTAEEAEENPNC